MALDHKYASWLIIWSPMSNRPLATPARVSISPILRADIAPFRCNRPTFSLERVATFYPRFYLVHVATRSSSPPNTRFALFRLCFSSFAGFALSRLSTFHVARLFGEDNVDTIWSRQISRRPAEETNRVASVRPIRFNLDFCLVAAVLGDNYICVWRNSEQRRGFSEDF